MPLYGPQIIPISDPRDARLADYANLKDRQLAAMSNPTIPDASGLFMAEGELVVRQLVISGLGIRSILITPTRVETMRDALAPLDPGIPIYLVPLETMSTLVGFHIHRGVLAAGVRPAARDPLEVIAKARTLVILENLANHDNVGGVFRTTAALAGLDSAILLSPQCCDPLYRKAIRVSMGMALRVPFATLSPWPGSLKLVREAGFRIIALTPDPSAPSIETLEVRQPVALLLGAEGPGLTQDAQSHADLRARIPMNREVDSLNVVTAAGIALNRLVRP